MSAYKLFLRFGRSLGPMLGLIVLCLGLWIATPKFVTMNNWLMILQQSSINATLALGMTFVILTAGIDLSVGSMLAFVGVVLASLLHSDLSMPVAILAALGLGTLIGMVNGSLIAWGKLPPFIVTLGMMSVARGAALIYTGGSPISGFNGNFRSISADSMFYISNMTFIMLLLFIAAHFVLTSTRYGRAIYAIGGNEHAAYLSGINVRIIKMSVYAFSGFCAAVAAVLLTSRLNSAGPLAGNMYELDAIAASVIGGTSLMGGEGTVFGTLVGALIIGVLRNGLNILEVNSYYQNVIIGSVIVISALLDSYLKSHKLAEVRT